MQYAESVEEINGEMERETEGRKSRLSSHTFGILAKGCVHDELLAGGDV